jgi:hypothetical protein
VVDTVSKPEERFFSSETIPPQVNGGLEGHNMSTTTPSISQGGLNSDRFQDLRKEFEEMQKSKMHSSAGRNTWQNNQKGGSGEPWTYNILVLPAGLVGHC